MDTPYCIENQYGGTFQRLDGEVSGNPFDMSDLDNCEVLLLDHSDRVNVTDVRNSRVFIGPCSSSVILYRCNNCTFTVATRDFQAIECRDCYVFLFTPDEPKLQKSDRIEFGPFNGAYAELEQQLLTADLEGRENLWWHIQDLDAEEDPTPHYKILSQEEYEQQCEPWLPFGPCDYVVPLSWPQQGEEGYGLDSVPLSRTPPSLDSYPSGGSAVGGVVGGGAAPVVVNNPVSPPDHGGASLHLIDEEWRRKWEASLEKRAEKEKAAAREHRDKAEEWLDSFYDQRTDMKAHRMARNREQEEYTLQRLRDAEVDENPFARVLQLVDVADKGNGLDLSRFRGLLIQLKETGDRPRLETTTSSELL